MLSDLLNKMASAPRENLFLAGAAVLIGALLAAMYIVCAAQVQSAHARHASTQRLRQAMIDCLDRDPRARHGACAGTAPNQLPAMVPVAYYSRQP